MASEEIQRRDELDCNGSGSGSLTPLDANALYIQQSSLDLETARLIEVFQVSSVAGQRGPAGGPGEVDPDLLRPLPATDGDADQGVDSSSVNISLPAGGGADEESGADRSQLRSVSFSRATLEMCADGIENAGAYDAEGVGSDVWRGTDLEGWNSELKAESLEQRQDRHNATANARTPSAEALRIYADGWENTGVHDDPNVGAWAGTDLEIINSRVVGETLAQRKHRLNKAAE